MYEVIMENQNFQFAHYDGTKIDHSHYTTYGVMAKRGSLAERCVVEIRVDAKVSKPADDVYEIPDSVKVSWGLAQYHVEVSDFIEVLTEARHFANKVIVWLNKHEDDCNLSLIV